MTTKILCPLLFFKSLLRILCHSSAPDLQMSGNDFQCGETDQISNPSSVLPSLYMDKLMNHSCDLMGLRLLYTVYRYGVQQGPMLSPLSAATVHYVRLVA